MSDPTAESREWLASEWAAHFAQAIEAMAEEKPGVSLEDFTFTSKTPDGTAEPVLWWRQEFSVAPGVPCWVGAPAQSWSAIGGRVLKAAGVDSEDVEGSRDTYLEILRQSLASLGQNLSGRLQTEVTCTAGSLGAPEGESLEGNLARLDLNGLECQIFVLVPAAFIEAVQRARESLSAQSSHSLPQVAPEASEKCVSMDLLLDVELPVSVSFGRAELPLKDVLKLTTGSIIELNRSVSEPVEIIVNNCVIARGEVVVVEGNFGVRVRQVISRQERMRTLK